MKTSEIFKVELGYIKNDVLREIVAKTLDTAPECIQTIPASSSGKYHPKADLGEGGLNRHVQSVVGIAKCLIDCDIFKNLIFMPNSYVSDYEKSMYEDVAYVSLILHDCMKPDDTPKHNIRFDHPLLASELFVNVSKQYLKDVKSNELKYISDGDIEYMKKVIPLVKGCIASHMGQWVSAPYAKGIVLPKPSSNIEVFVHMVDYLASRNFIDVDFDKMYGRV